MPIREYTQAKHRFFDEIALFLLTLSSSLVTAEVLRTGGQSKVASDPLYYLQFESCSLFEKLTWYPQEGMISLASNGWPKTISLHESLIHPRAPVFALSSSEAKSLHSVALQSCFLRYFEAYRQEIEAKYGTDPWAWPMPWNFARVLRNACAHGGVLTFQNASSKAVTWRTLTYSPTEQGRQIIFRDMNFVEILALLEELDAFL